MRRKLFFSLIAASVLSHQVGYAQDRDISGKIVDAKTRETISSATIRVKGTQQANSSNSNGTFSLKTDKKGTLIISAVGYLPMEVPIGSETNFNIMLVPADSQLEEVVVTAMGIKRSERSLGYSAAQLSASSLNENKQSNLVNAMQGKIAGVSVTTTGGAPGQGASIQIRGINSVDPKRDNQPLFVIDGVLMDNGTSESGSRADQRGMSNRAVDINPEDIETMNILKGGAATALYGLRGANGVVVITTKSGKEGKIKLNYQGAYGFENPNKLPELQNKYSIGWAGVYDPESFWPSFGPTVEEAKKLDPTHPDKLYSILEDAFNTGNQFRNSLNFSGGTEQFTFMSSLSQLQQKGILPGTDFKNLQGRINTSFKTSDKLQFSVNMNVNNSGGSRGRAGRFMEQLIYWSPRYDIRDAFHENGTVKSYTSDNINPIGQALTNRFSDNVLRFIGGFGTSYKPTSWLDLNYKIGLDTYRDERKATAPGFQGLPGEYSMSDNGIDAAPGLGLVGFYNRRFRSINSTFVASATKQLGKDFSGTLRLGHELYDRSILNNETEGGDLAIPTSFSLQNARIVTPYSEIEKYRLMGAFGELAMSYKDLLYLNITGRNDITSSLNKPNNSFFYPSVSLSYIFNEQLHLPKAINYAKFRFSYAQIGKDALPYATAIGYTKYQNLPLAYTGYLRYENLGDTKLKPEFTNTFETGLEIKFLNSRLALDLNLYQSKSTNQIIQVPVSSATGFVYASINAGSMQNKGLELSLTGTPVKSTDFEWSSGLNFSLNRNKILSLRDDLTEIPVASESGYLSSTITMKLIRGESYGTLYGRALKRYFSPDELAAGLDKSTNIDPNRPLLIGSNGFPQLDASSNQKKMGNVQPDWLAGWSNDFRYKNFSMSVLIDAKVGQDRYNSLNNSFASFGSAKYSEDRNDHKVFAGVLADGSTNTKEVWLGQGKDPKDGVDYGNGYYRNIYRGVSEYFVEDASWVRLRSVSLSYRIPSRWITGQQSIKSMQFSVVGNNLALWTKYSGFDPESTSTSSGSNIEGFSGMTYPAVRSFLFSVNIGF